MITEEMKNAICQGISCIVVMIVLVVIAYIIF